MVERREGFGGVVEMGCINWTRVFQIENCLENLGIRVFVPILGSMME